MADVAPPTSVSLSFDRMIARAINGIERHFNSMIVGSLKRIHCHLEDTAGQGVNDHDEEISYLI